MEHPSRSSLILPASILAIGVLLATLVFSAAYRDVRKDKRTIDISGSAERLVASDTAKWSLSVSRQADTTNLKDVVTQLTADGKTLSDYLVTNGLKREEITLQPPSITPLCDSQGGVNYDRFGNPYCASSRLIGYALQQPMVVETVQVDKLTTLAQSTFSALASQGIVLTSAGIEYYIRDLNQVKMQLLSDATKNAKERAEKILQGTGASIGELRSASVGVFQVTAVNSTEISDYGAYDTAAQQKKVTSIVRASFDLK
ncbi:SIMPL domain-containing protein [Patescibacteria group bacterium]|nr:SIMPL domain-containing protein [Patescibacteria group bacterium]